MKNRVYFALRDRWNHTACRSGGSNKNYYDRDGKPRTLPWAAIHHDFVTSDLTSVPPLERLVCLHLIVDLLRLGDGKIPADPEDLKYRYRLGEAPELDAVLDSGEFLLVDQAGEVLSA